MTENYIYKMYEWEVLPYDFTKGTWHCKSINMKGYPKNPFYSVITMSYIFLTRRNNR